MSESALISLILKLAFHINEIFLPHNGFDHKAQIFSDGITIAFAYDLTGILNSKLDFQILVPVGIYLKFAFSDPSGIIFIDVFNLKAMFDVEFFQSCQD